MKAESKAEAVASVDLKQFKVSKRGQPFEGEPEKGQYYTLDVPRDTDVKKLRKSLKKQYPGTFFNIRFSIEKVEKPGAAPQP